MVGHEVTVSAQYPSLSPCSKSCATVGSNQLSYQMIQDPNLSVQSRMHAHLKMLMTIFESSKSPQNCLPSWQNSVKLFLQLSFPCILLVHIQFLAQVLIFNP